jgi:hypothetical protein
MNYEIQQPNEMEIGTTKSGTSPSSLAIEAYAGSDEMLSVDNVYKRNQGAHSPGDSVLLALGDFGISEALDQSQESVRLAQLDTSEPIENPDSRREVLSLERLPYAAIGAAANGESSVLIATGSGVMVGAFLPIPVSEPLNAQVKSLQALGFKP